MSFNKTKRKIQSECEDNDQNSKEWTAYLILTGSGLEELRELKEHLDMNGISYEESAVELPSRISFEEI